MRKRDLNFGVRGKLNLAVTRPRNIPNATSTRDNAGTCRRRHRDGRDIQTRRINRRTGNCSCVNSVDDVRDDRARCDRRAVIECAATDISAGKAIEKLRPPARTNSIGRIFGKVNLEQIAKRRSIAGRNEQPTLARKDRRDDDRAIEPVEQIVSAKSEIHPEARNTGPVKIGEIVDIDTCAARDDRDNRRKFLPHAARRSSENLIVV